MCGIAGIVNHDPDRPVEAARVGAMMAALHHRGPDDEGVHFEGPVGLGFKRLSIIDLASGNQPMCNEDGSVWIVFNGEIYNYLELRRDLARQHVFRSHSDTEVILHLYEDLGPDCLERLNGMFAFAIWDRRRGRLFAARDRLGIKPFYWHASPRGFAFASEPKALFAGGVVEPRPDHAGLEQYIAFQFCLGDRTMFEEVRRLEPGHYLTYRPGSDSAPTVSRYWGLGHEIDDQHSEEWFADQLLVLLQDSVRLQLRSDVPVGAHLSGGIDSSTVACLASRVYDGQFRTFTGGFREGPRYDETGYARIVANHMGSEHFEVWPTAQQFAEVLPRLVYMMDEPAAGPGLFPQYAVSKLASEHVKVVLGGQGGDEIFGGYARYLVAYLEQCLKGAIYGTQEDGRYVVTWENIAPNLPLLREYRPLLQAFWREGLFEDMDARYFRLVNRASCAESVISADVWTADSRARTFGAFQEVFGGDAPQSYFCKMTNFDLETQLPALLQVEDRMSMAVSLESRVPLLDHRIVELVTRMPPPVRFRGGDTKRVFRDAVQHLLPREIYERRDKMGFPVPLAEWYAGPLRDFVSDILLGQRARQRGVFDVDGVERAIGTEGRFGRDVWGLLCLELWFRTFIDGDAFRPGGEVGRATEVTIR